MIVFVQALCVFFEFKLLFFSELMSAGGKQIARVCMYVFMSACPKKVLICSNTT